MCPICGKSPVLPLFGATSPEASDGPEFLLVRCQGCGLVRLDPPPSAAQLAAAYRDQYSPATAATGASLIATWGARLFLTARKRRIERLARGRRLLDVGCGTGDFLNVMHEAGWDVAGVEPNAEARRRAPASLQERIVDTLDAVSGAPFDVITLWHVIEHLPSPAADIEKLTTLLRPGGALFIAVPNFASWEAAIGGTRWFHLDLPRHLYHFTPETLSHLLDDHGFTVDRIDFFSWIYNVFGAWQTLLNRVVPERNYLYRRWRQRMPQPARGSRWRSTICSVLSYAIAPAAAVVAVALSAAAALAGRSGTIEVVATVRTPAPASS
ncbi:MAG: class I SAM-dependent methyltransferase [Acidimicrobiia bacterium]|nr:class I SAM-dependent methyltransferase [Acidimicrobiia bacterium]